MNGRILLYLTLLFGWTKQAHAQSQPNITLLHKKLRNNRTIEKQIRRYQQKKKSFQSKVTAKDKHGDTLRLLSLCNAAYSGILLRCHGVCFCFFRNPKAELHLGEVWVFSLLDNLLIDVYINPRNPWTDHLAHTSTNTVCGCVYVYTKAWHRSQELTKLFFSQFHIMPSPSSLHSRPQKLRWPSFQNSHRPSLASAQLQISCQSVLQMNLLQKLSLLQLTALLEKHTPTNKHGFSWWVDLRRVECLCKRNADVLGRRWLCTVIFLIQTCVKLVIFYVKCLLRLGNCYPFRQPTTATTLHPTQSLPSAGCCIVWWCLSTEVGFHILFPGL